MLKHASILKFYDGKQTLKIDLKIMVFIIGDVIVCH